MGVLGAARIAPAAVVRPARAVPDVVVTAVAARDRARAEAFAGRHGIPRVLPDYRSLVEDPDLDAVYIPLPNGLHGAWTTAALAAGKHVLCEKPFTANVDEAMAVQQAAARTPGLVVMEAFHYRYHPLFARVRHLLEEGAVGTVRHVDTRLCFPLLRRGDIRWDLGLAGGALMDAGCYTVHMLRHLAGVEPTVTAARARLARPGVDRFLQATYDLPGGATGRTTCSMRSTHLLDAGFTVAGDAGVIRVLNPLAPQVFHRVSVRTGGCRRVERSVRRPTYEFQLEAFADAVLRGVAPVTGVDDAVANMAVIDAVYRAAGLEPRVPSVV
ncbi:MAG: Gfo/Idh/MocA family oxidoreductase [Acidobacteriota bacterium]|nr:Gfo/Idh/MocA family oxidoreductase [Acidobacteriota bacterium]